MVSLPASLWKSMQTFAMFEGLPRMNAAPPLDASFTSPRGSINPTLRLCSSMEVRLFDPGEGHIYQIEGIAVTCPSTLANPAEGGTDCGMGRYRCEFRTEEQDKQKFRESTSTQSSFQRKE